LNKRLEESTKEISDLKKYSEELKEKLENEVKTKAF